MPSSRSRTRGRTRGRGRSAQRGRTRSRGRGRGRTRGRARSRSMNGGMYGGPTMDSSSSSLGSAPFHRTISIMKSQQGGTGNMASNPAFNYSPLNKALNAA